MPRKKYRMVGLPEELYAEVEKIVTTGRYGYASVSEFVKDAVRRRLEELARFEEIRLQSKAK